MKLQGIDDDEEPQGESQFKGWSWALGGGWRIPRIISVPNLGTSGYL